MTKLDATIDAQTSARLDLALAIARGVGPSVLTTFDRYVRRDLTQADMKPDGSPVTLADRKAEEVLRQRITDAFPQDAILGEEFGEIEGTTGWRWILDPIDGTRSFMQGVPLFGTLIACEYEGTVRAGVIHMPALNETVHAALGQGAWHSLGDRPPRRARVSTTPVMEEAVVCATAPRLFAEHQTEDAFSRLWRASKAQRGWSDCYASVLLATGRVDAVVEPLMERWDIAPLQPIVLEAGGRVTDWAGNTDLAREAVLSNGTIHDELLGVLRPE